MYRAVFLDLDDTLYDRTAAVRDHPFAELAPPVHQLSSIAALADVCG